MEPSGGGVRIAVDDVTDVDRPISDQSTLCLQEVLKDEIVTGAGAAGARAQSSSGVKRKVGSIGALTGADGVHYAEFRAKSAPAGNAPKRHKIFKQYYTGKF